MRVYNVVVAVKQFHDSFVKLWNFPVLADCPLEARECARSQAAECAFFDFTIERVES